MVDANMRWRVHETIAAARVLAPFSLVGLEEPVVPEDLEGLARAAVEGGSADRGRILSRPRDAPGLRMSRTTPPFDCA